MSRMDNEIDGLFWEINTLFHLYHDLTISDIKRYLDSKQKFFDVKEIGYVINILMVDYGVIVRDDHWEKEALYRYVVNTHYQNSSFTRHYYSFSVDNNYDKKILLISDTHIGNLELEDFKLLHNIYDWALKMGVKRCFHLGDVFERSEIMENRDKVIEKQFEMFSKYYPDCDDIRTYSLIGNHDEYVNGFFGYDKMINIPYEYDLRQLSKFVNNFYVIPRNTWNIDFGNVKMHLSHRLYINWMIRDKKIFNLDDIDSDNFFNSLDYNLLISGHLHNGFIYNYVSNKQDHLLLGVPSTSKVNNPGVVGYVISLNYDEYGNVNSADITLLLNDNDKVYEGETIDWNFCNKNKFLKRVFKR